MTDIHSLPNLIDTFGARVSRHDITRLKCFIRDGGYYSDDNIGQCSELYLLQFDNDSPMFMDAHKHDLYGRDDDGDSDDGNHLLNLGTISGRNSYAIVQKEK